MCACVPLGLEFKDYIVCNRPFTVLKKKDNWSLLYPTTPDAPRKCMWPGRGHKEKKNEINLCPSEANVRGGVLSRKANTGSLFPRATTTDGYIYLGNPSHIIRLMISFLYGLCIHIFCFFCVLHILLFVVVVYIIHAKVNAESILFYFRTNRNEIATPFPFVRKEATCYIIVYCCVLYRDGKKKD